MQLYPMYLSPEFLTFLLVRSHYNHESEFTPEQDSLGFTQYVKVVPHS